MYNHIFLFIFFFYNFLGGFLYFNYIQFTRGLHYNSQTLIHLFDLSYFHVCLLVHVICFLSVCFFICSFHFKFFHYSFPCSELLVLHLYLGIGLSSSIVVLVSAVYSWCLALHPV